MEDEPALDQRTIVFIISDGSNQGMYQLMISVLPINDHPTEVC